MDQSPRQYLHEAANARNRARSWEDEDGLIIGLSKRVLGSSLLHWPYHLFVSTVLRIRGELDVPTARAEAQVRLAADVYMFVGGLTVAACYWLLGLVARSHLSNLSVALVAALLVLPLYRLFEYLSVTMLLHGRGPYSTTAPMRAVAKTMWAYLEIVVVFASVYVAIAVTKGDTFGLDRADSFSTDAIAPLYFSMVTITTVGYGDLAAQTGLARSTVMTEILVGLVFLVVALQRVLTVSMAGAQDRRK